MNNLNGEKSLWNKMAVTGFIFALFSLFPTAFLFLPILGLQLPFFHFIYELPSPQFASLILITYWFISTGILGAIAFLFGLIGIIIIRRTRQRGLMLSVIALLPIIILIAFFYYNSSFHLL